MGVTFIFRFQISPSYRIHVSIRVGFWTRIHSPIWIDALTKANMYFGCIYSSARSEHRTGLTDCNQAQPKFAKYFPKLCVFLKKYVILCFFAVAVRFAIWTKFMLSFVQKWYYIIIHEYWLLTLQYRGIVDEPKTRKKNAITRTTRRVNDRQ